MRTAAKRHHSQGGHSERPPEFPGLLIEGHQGSVSHDANEPAIASLQSRVPARRVAAAEILGKQREMTSFVPLVRALQAEKDENAQIAILSALRNIGGATYPEPERMELALGYGPILHFMIGNTGKPNLIELALDAFGFTGTIDTAITGIKLIRTIAELKGHTASTELASSAYMELENPH